MKSKLLGLLAASAALLACAAHSAQADNLSIKYTTTAQAWTGSGSPLVYLSGGGVQSFVFTNPLAGYVSVTFNAECQVRGPTSSWLVLRAYIDGNFTAVPPSGGDTAFCSGSGNTTAAAAVSRPSMTVGKVLSAGSHSFAITAHVIGSHTQTYLDDTITVVAR